MRQTKKRISLLFAFILALSMVFPVAVSAMENLGFNGTSNEVKETENTTVDTETNKKEEKKEEESKVRQPRAGENFTAKMEWLDASDATDATWSSIARGNFLARYQLSIETNASYAVGAMEIRVPTALLKKRDGNELVPSKYGISQTPGSEDSPFYYKTQKVNGEEIVIFTNWQELTSAKKYIIQVDYNLNAETIIDGTVGKLQATVKATAKGESEEEIKNSQQITYTVDTQVKLTSVKKTAVTPMYSWDKSEWGSKPTDFDNYRWVKYKFEVKGLYNQQYYLKLQDISSTGGELITAYAETEDNKNSIIDISNDTITTKVFKQSDRYTGINVGRTYTLYAAVKYPKNGVVNLENQLKVTIIGDDLGDSDTMTNSSIFPWQEFQFPYTGDLATTDKYLGKKQTTGQNFKSGYDNTALIMTDNNRDAPIYQEEKGWRIRSTTYGFNRDSYRVELYDDYLDWMDPDGNMVEMTSDDYYHSKVEVGGSFYELNTTNGEKIVPKKGATTAPKLEVWALVAGNSNYTKVGSDILTSNLYWQQDEDSPIENATQTVTLPANTYRVLLKIPKAKGYAEIEAYVQMVLKKSSPTLASWRLAESDIDDIFIRNFSALEMRSSDGYHLNPTTAREYGLMLTTNDIDYNNMVMQRDRDYYDMLIQRSSATVTLRKPIVTSSTIKKVSSVKNEPENKLARLYYAMHAFEINLTTESEKEYLKELGWEPIERQEAAFYDLLPLGTYFDSTARVAVASANYKEKDEDLTYEVELINNYEGTGRQMVIIKLKMKQGKKNVNWNTPHFEFYTTAGYGISNGTSFGPSSTGVQTGFSVAFGVVVSWEDIHLAKDKTNLALYQIKDELLADGEGDIGFPEKDPLKTQFQAVKKENGDCAFKDVNNDGKTDKKDSYYISCAQPINVPVSASSGLTKLVQAEKDGAQWLTDTKTKASGLYTYRLQLYNGQATGELKDIILFDKLETAQTGWKGTFDSIDLHYLTAMDVVPKIYYSTVDNPSTFKPSDAVPAQWTTTQPTDKTKIKAIAIDLSKKKSDSTGFSLGNLEMVTVLINMKAPATKPTQSYAYNNASSYWTMVPTSGQPIATEQTCDKTSVAFSYDEVIQKEANPAGGATEDGATAVNKGDTVTYTLNYNAGEPGNIDITASDIIPDGMTLVPGSIKYKANGSSTTTSVANSAYNNTTRKISWPKITVDGDGISTFTFQVTVDKLSGVKEKVYANKGAFLIGTETKETNTVYHKQTVTDVDFEFIKIKDNNTNEPLAGAEFKLYKCTNTTGGHVHDTLVTTKTTNCWTLITDGTKTSLADGKIAFAGLDDGDYRLVETKAPDGRERPLGQWSIKVDVSATNPFTITPIAANGKLPPAFIENNGNYYLPNYQKTLLPASGGKGTTFFMTMGTLLVGIGVFSFVSTRKKKNSVLGE